MLSRILKYTQALLGLWLIVEISVFPSGAALWIAFATAIAFTAVAAVDAFVGFLRGRLLPPILAVGVVLLGGFLMAATLVFEHASATWLVAIAGGAVEACALTAIGLPRLRVRAEVEAEAAAPTPESRLAA